MDVELEIWGSDREGITHDNSPNQTTQCMTIMPRDYIKTSLISHSKQSIRTIKYFPDFVSEQ